MDAFAENQMGREPNMSKAAIAQMRRASLGITEASDGHQSDTSQAGDEQQGTESAQGLLHRRASRMR